MPAGQEKPPWGVARPRGRVCVLHRIWANAQRDKLPHVIARVARPVAIRAPALPPTSNPVRGIRIATGINALAMTWENIHGCVCTWVSANTRCVLCGPSRRPVPTCPYRVRRKSRCDLLRTVWEAGPYKGLPHMAKYIYK